MHNYSEMTNEELLSLKVETEKKVAKYNNLQLAKKVCL